MKLCAMLDEYLTGHGWQVHFAHRGSTGIAAARKFDGDLIVLDAMLPDLDGFEILRRLHQEADVRVLMLTARGEEIDRITGLELGADDYVAKPFNPRELLARMRAVLRRSHAPQVSGADLRATSGDFSVNPQFREISYAGQKMELTQIEFLLLQFLLERSHTVVDREELVQNVFERSYHPFDRSADMHVMRLRRKLELLPGFSGGIKTIRYVGYMLTLKANPSDQD
jgi:DNA-binding response OmpR family regulator